jgi:hypothetical protein
MRNGISVRNDTNTPLLIVFSQITPLHWGRVEPGQIFNYENRDCNMGRVWFTVTAMPWNPDEEPTIAGVTASIAGIAVAVVGVAAIAALLVLSVAKDGGNGGGGGGSGGSGGHHHHHHHYSAPIIIDHYGPSGYGSGPTSKSNAGDIMRGVYADGKTLVITADPVTGVKINLMTAALIRAQGTRGFFPPPSLTGDDEPPVPLTPTATSEERPPQRIVNQRDVSEIAGTVIMSSAVSPGCTPDLISRVLNTQLGLDAAYVSGSSPFLFVVPSRADAKALSELTASAPIKCGGSDVSFREGPSVSTRSGV